MHSILAIIAAVGVVAAGVFSSPAVTPESRPAKAAICMNQPAMATAVGSMLDDISAKDWNQVQAGLVPRFKWVSIDGPGATRVSVGSREHLRTKLDRWIKSVGGDFTLDAMSLEFGPRGRSVYRDFVMSASGKAVGSSPMRVLGKGSMNCKNDKLRVLSMAVSRRPPVLVCKAEEAQDVGEIKLCPVMR